MTDPEDDGRDAAAVHGAVFIATSLDGFIARPDGAIDWLPEPGADDTSDTDAGSQGTDGGGDARDPFGYDAFFASVDAMVMGRNTFDLVRTFGAWPYGDKRVVVLTSRPLDLPDDAAGRVTTSQGSPEEVARRLADEGVGRVYVDGGRTIQAFLRAGLIRDLTITRIPVLLGEGIPLFGPTDGDVRLRHERTHVVGPGLVQSTYTVVERTAGGPSSTPSPGASGGRH